MMFSKDPHKHNHVSVGFYNIISTQLNKVGQSHDATRAVIVLSSVQVRTTLGKPVLIYFIIVSNKVDIIRLDGA